MTLISQVATNSTNCMNEIPTKIQIFISENTVVFFSVSLWFYYFQLARLEDSKNQLDLRKSVLHS